MLNKEFGSRFRRTSENHQPDEKLDHEGILRERSRIHLANAEAAIPDSTKTSGVESKRIRLSRMVQT
jgi:hypothetical protein